MLKILRQLLGLCIHQFDVIAHKEIMTRPNGTFLSIDMDGKYVSHHLFISACKHCGMLQTRKINVMTGKIYVRRK